MKVIRAQRIITMTAAAPEALAVDGGRIEALGSAADLAARYPDAERIDLHDGVLVPGFNDVHMHLAITAENLLHLDLSAGVIGSLAELEALIREEAGRTPPGQWIRGSRYDDGKMPEGRVLDRAALDRVAPEHPVLVTHVASHWGIVNSRALAAAGIDDASEPPPGGDYGRDAAGHLNGILFEQAYFDFAEPAASRTRTAVVPRVSMEERLSGLQRGVQMFHAAGLTSITDALTGVEDLGLFREAEKQGLLSLRLGVLVPHEYYDMVRDSPPSSELGAGHIRLAGIKAFIDGAIGGRTCLLEQPFEGQSDDYGIQTMPTETLRELVSMVHEDGHRMCVHANGDRAIRLLLDALGNARERHPDRSSHPRIEHCTIVNEEILREMRRLDAAAVPFGSYVRYHGSKLLDWYGEDRLERMFAHRWLIDMGLEVAGSSDYPCGPYEPLLAMQSCVTRRGWDGPVLAPAQRISPYEALSLYTTRAASLEGQADVKGRLMPGFLADMVVLDDDPLTVDPDTIGEIGVRETYVGGEPVFSRP